MGLVCNKTGVRKIYGGKDEKKIAVMRPRINQRTLNY